MIGDAIPKKNFHVGSDGCPPPRDGPPPPLPRPTDHKDGGAAINKTIPLDHLWVKSRSKLGLGEQRVRILGKGRVGKLVNTSIEIFIFGCFLRTNDTRYLLRRSVLISVRGDFGNFSPPILFSQFDNFNAREPFSLASLPWTWDLRNDTSSLINRTISKFLESYQTDPEFRLTKPL